MTIQTTSATTPPTVGPAILADKSFWCQGLAFSASYIILPVGIPLGGGVGEPTGMEVVLKVVLELKVAGGVETVECVWFPTDVTKVAKPEFESVVINGRRRPSKGN